ncbi:hypothetical protein A3D80_00545 [Candidatus Roizmanbacteria bacterium RIFCSPHIGHO2_02_FULL_40_13b]|uniref:Uncharacterized protein n=1 Tax=Candidatus Roizmanbacteria bacterium RIFCSPHIGHO2_01_FULL_39_24 TaxID=1802032 RepID=A0A1F7GKD7_9BACT|nr:MAG: hypothetical protein A2799_02510 [Candidatus Roizmanbacteria bacterium RIFCSPHIGHO2_01_FULL_39_24]OGK27436.1 MAG: hypothetical protein A3D80_00545 [Candidatus Roizmanbacteria bacterium RIFCSPHIGHO2_02_FULL_40_13b]OGK50419.1 MAG: hypothetical protein A3A56_02205 [Candidatus Roizmanbacteria bacterium RIFCSPLOWO2_01_FULL_40_32]OGK56983.1 MAG: hypothetical protein A3H83_00405 [Candidatus Roizmanbacteria bacterium RIFCSPLOWO2_02_FULL_39_8]
MKLAQDVGDAFGKITPPPGAFNVDPVYGLGKIITTGIQLVLAAAGIMLLFYLMWGGFDWLMSGGDKEKLMQAQQKLTNAIIGLFVIIGALTIFTYVTGNLLGIIKVGNGFHFTLPTLDDTKIESRPTPCLLPPGKGGPPVPC